MSAPRVSAVVAAAGLSRRFSPYGKKQFAELGGKPIVAHSICTLESSEFVKSIVVVVPEDEISRSKDLLKGLGFEKITSVVGGGKKRHISVRNGFRATPPESDMVLIHDAARPFINNDMIKKVLDGCVCTGACICAVAVTDTLKQTEKHGMFVSETVSRKNIWRAQTPQVFHRDILEEIYRSDAVAEIDATDESALVEAMGINVQIVEGSNLNIKITTAADLEIAELILSKGGSVSVQNRNRV
ncbi:MAG: 2-C-methyl-D-erythritol 4-phosphate cytidylyltransferase [Candidatus Dadabacteria bacterium]|nr:2-C-methyl-D-erythritol 4-phosphate cytidylyltransferase [Candidatus Dadabacteria bacterium]MCY4261795.1 2-C-methyl-D-erythritol 4-phosphate cytidylyltransferase [Candidatus Dadabacteria bacterium]